MIRCVSLWALLALAVGPGALGGCAEPVENIDRTQGNLIRKADLDGQWFIMQTILDVPATYGWRFTGETSETERIRWVIRKHRLIAYRAYPRLRGSNNPSTDDAFDGTENPIAEYVIEAHVDLKREYDPTTGQQTNVLGENAVDRLWHEREYMRVDWAVNRVPNLSMVISAAAAQDTEGEFILPDGFFFEPEEATEDAFYSEVTDGRLQYFDVKTVHRARPDFYGCMYTWWGIAAEDCTAAEITARTAFLRAPERPDYAAFHYSDQLMSRYGYFRTEFFTYDEQRGTVDSGRRFLINRHNIWQRTLTDDGTPIPLPDRSLKAVPYYLGRYFPDDPLLIEAARETMAQWNRAVKRGLAEILPADALESDVFILCQNPVAEEDPDDCGARGFSPREGDLRYSTLHWVDTATLAGLLGYGPVASDPLTGEIISGRAYVYGAAISTWATYAVDVIRYFNDDLDFETLVRGGQFTDTLRARLEGKDAPARPSAKLREKPVSRSVHRRGRPMRPARKRRELRPYAESAVQTKLDLARASGQSSMLLSTEMKNALSVGRASSWEAMDPAMQDRLDPTRSLNPVALKRMARRRKALRARSVDFLDMVSPDIQGIVQKYLGRDDYDQMWRELRAEIFAATAEHEVGHTLGLRHNFQGSYDSLNYPDEYWRLREQTLKPIQTLADIYSQTNLTETQHAGLMRQKQYSSIMDYGFSWQSDLNGVGKYDEAALIFGYTAGYYAAEGARCAAYPSIEMGTGCLAKLPGLVEVFRKSKAELGRAGEILDQTELGFTYDDPGLPSVAVLERFHYTTLATAFPSLDDLTAAGRRLMPYADFLAAKEAAKEAGKETDDRPIRVPYSFCSDEWEGGLISCRAFDLGADPFELTLSRINDYRANYPFVNYRRDRVGFDISTPLFTYYYRVFLPLSDAFQSWYVAPFGFDPAFDRTYDLAINAGFNILAEVLSTPAYGTWCETPEGQLAHFSEDAKVQDGDDGYVDCASSGRLVIERGQGRRQFTAYDPADGYYFMDRPKEAGHYWATLAALWALTDNEAFLLGVDGDAGTYSISMFDWFGDEFSALMNALMTQDFATFAPRLEVADDADTSDTYRGRLRYQRPAPLFDNGELYDPETGAAIAVGPLGGPKSLCQTCASDDECAGYTGELGGAYCQPIGDNSERLFCLIDCTNEDRCPEGTYCDAVGNCAPEDDELAGCIAIVGRCDADHLFGRCSSSQTCVDGVCTGPKIMQAERTFSLATDILWYGFIYTTSSYSPRFNDQMNVFRPGGPNSVEVDPALGRRYTFTDPISGAQYAAVQANCEGPAPSAQCRFQSPGDTGAVQLVKKGQRLADAYNARLEAWYSYTTDLPDFTEAEDSRRSAAYFRARFELNSHVELLATVEATFNIFGRLF